MGDDAAEGLYPKRAFAQLYVSVLMAGKGIPGIIQMERLQPVETHDLIELAKDSVKVAYDVIAAVVHMAGIQAYAQIITAHSIDDVTKLLKAAADLAALACHGLQEHGHRITMGQRLLQGLSDIADPCLGTLPHMAAGMEIIKLSRERRHPAKVIAKELPGKCPGFRVPGTKIHRIGSMGHNWAKPMFPQQLTGQRFIFWVFFSRSAAPGIAGEESEGIGTDGKGRFDHRHIAAGGRQVAS